MILYDYDDDEYVDLTKEWDTAKTVVECDDDDPYEGYCTDDLYIGFEDLEYDEDENGDIWWHRRMF